MQFLPLETIVCYFRYTQPTGRDLITWLLYFIKQISATCFGFFHNLSSLRRPGFATLVTYPVKQASRSCLTGFITLIMENKWAFSWKAMDWLFIFYRRVLTANWLNLLTFFSNWESPFILRCLFYSFLIISFVIFIRSKKYIKFPCY
jgi:hypothetical protein